MKLTKQIQSKVTNKLKSSQREYYLREQLKAIQEELGELSGKGRGGKGGAAGEPEENVLETLRRKLDALELRELRGGHQIAMRGPLL